MLRVLFGGKMPLWVLFLFCFWSVSQAGAQVAPGVTQSAAQTATVSGTVVTQDGSAIANARLRLDGANAHLTSVSDSHGTFVFTSVPFGTYTIEATAITVGVASHAGIIVKGDTNVTIQYVAAVAGLKEIARVSTASAGSQINVTPASIASVTPSDYAFAGNTSWQQLLNRIPGVTVGGGLQGGNFTGVTIPDGPFQPIVLSINGALPYETSTLLDGMPITNISFAFAGSGGGAGSGTDLSFLPMSIFDTADVVRGPGANSPSIVDSIGGSFVLHAPNPTTANHFELSAGTDPYGGVVSNTKVTFHLGRLSAEIAYGINNSPGPLGVTHAIVSDATPPSSVNGQAFAGNYPTYIPCATFQNTFCGIQNTLLYCCVPLSTEWSQHSGAIALSYTLSPRVTAQVFYAGSTVNQPDAYASSPVQFTPGAGYTGSITPGNHTFLYGGPAYYLAQSESLLEEKITTYVGNGIVRLAALQNNSFTSINVPYTYPNGTYTLWGTGAYASAPTTMVSFNGTSAPITFLDEQVNCRQWVNNRDLLGSYATQVGPKTTVGVSYVTSYYNAPFTSSFFLGAPYNISGSSTQSSAVSQTTDELRLNVGLDVSSNLSLGASWYVANANYHIVQPGSTNLWTNSAFSYSAPRLSATWRVNQNIAIRGSAGGGFALPPIGDLNPLGGSSPIPFCSGGVCSVTLPNLNLRPEEAFGFDLGTDMRLRTNTVLSLDVYRTNLFGQFFQSTNFTGTCPTCGGLPVYTTKYGNLSESRFEGVNLDLRHDVPRGIYWHGSLGLTRGYVVSVPAGFYNMATCTNCTNTYIVPGINFTGEYQSTVPYATASGQLGYRWMSGTSVELVPTLYGKNNPYFVPPFLEFDGNVRYALTKNVSLLASFRNITGIYDRNYQLGFTPTLGAPTVGNTMPYGLNGIPYGPRTVIFTANFKY